MSQQVSLLQRCARTTAEAMPRLRTLGDLSGYWIEVGGEFETLEMLRLTEVADRLEEAADAIAVAVST